VSPRSRRHPPTPHGGVPPGSPAVGRGSPDSAALQRSWGAGAPGLGPATTAHAPDPGERGENSGQVQRPSVLLLACAVPTFPTLIRKCLANCTEIPRQFNGAVCRTTCIFLPMDMCGCTGSVLIPVAHNWLCVSPEAPSWHLGYVSSVRHEGKESIHDN